MVKNSIDQTITYQEEIAVVDAELLFSTKRKWFKRYPEFSDFNMRVINYLIRKKSHHIDKIIVVCTKDLKYIEKVLYENLLLSTFDVMQFVSEESMKSWMKMVNPVIHLATPERRYHCKKSLLAEDALKN